jgi:site-specific DNA recombinase
MIAIYCRISTDDQNIHQQRDLLVEYCKKNNLQYRTFLDEAVSGKLIDRPSWNKLLKECETKDFDSILVTKFDRITRNLKYSIEFLEWLQVNNIKLISLYDGVFEFTPDQVFMFKMKCLLSEHELEVTKWRSRIGIERAKKEGKYLGRKKGSLNKLTS